MPAWGKNMGDEYIWNMAAFLQVLPTLDATAYKELVDSSEGHSHGGGETQGHHDDEKAEDHPAPSEPGNNSMPHAHPPGVDDDHHGPTLSDTEVGLVDHRHPNGKVESHPAPHTHVAGAGHAHTHLSPWSPRNDRHSHPVPPRTGTRRRFPHNAQGDTPPTHPPHP